ncbi:signal peptidase I [bacterium]|nr:signal peptidase I [bacterium]
MTITRDKILDCFLDFVETVVVSLAIFFVIYIFIVQPHQVDGHSMDPNLQTGEYLLTEKISYRFGQPQRGEVIVFKAPQTACIGPSCEYIKRIIGLPGETVRLSEGKIYINGQLLDESNYLAASVVSMPGAFTAGEREVVLADDQYFVCGDNRAGSSDSRHWGPINKQAIIGRAYFSYWPVKTFGLIDQGKGEK